METDALWVRVLKKKYCTNRRINSSREARLPSSPTWRGMRRGEGTFKKGIKWNPGWDSTLNFWTDVWSNLGLIRNVIHGPIPQADLDLKVRDVITSYGSWDWSMIPFELPENVKAEIQGTPMPIVARGGDKLVWKLSQKGNFEMRSAYLLAIIAMEDPPFIGS